MANMRILIRIVFIIFIANGIDCLGDNNCCNCFKEKDEETKEYEEIEGEGNITAESLINKDWIKTKENNPVLKIFKKKDNGLSPSEGNGDKISIKLDENNSKIADQNEAENKLKLNGKKYAFFEIKTNTDKTVYLYCSDVESSGNDYRVYGIFENTNHKSISVIACNTEKVRNMKNMFSRCSSLEKLDLNNFNTTIVTNMYGIFYECSSLTEINLKNFNTENVTDMGFMYSNCSSLKEINLKNFNTENVTDMGGMFSWCSSLTELNLKNFNTKNVTNMVNMFFACSSLKKLKIGDNFNTKNNPNVEKMFYNCDNLLENRINEILGKK